jgi:microcompartment protein CcmK/EutM
MTLGSEVGTVWWVRQHASRDPLKWLTVEPVSPALEREGGGAVAVDGVGAGLHEAVLYGSGSSRRLAPVTKDKPVDAVIMAIVDSFDIDGRVSRLA